METINLNGITCHIIINGADLPTIYWGKMEKRTESIEKVRALCEDVKCNYVIFEVQDWNSAFSSWKFEISKKQSFSGCGRNTLEWLMNVYHTVSMNTVSTASESSADILLQDYGSYMDGAR